MLPETVAAWKSLEGRVIDGKIRLDVLESHDRLPVFAGDIEGRPVTVRFFHEPDGSTAVFNRHREAAFLSHPNLLPCIGTGTVELQDAERFTYGVYESPNILLATLTDAKTFTEEEIRTLCQDILDGLDFLHSRGLVYCNLDRTTVARCGDRWKLCDYSELRPEGSGYSEETRRLLGVLPGAPPEAYSGVVSPGWDMWSLAHLLRSVIAAPPPARSADGTPMRPPRAPELPEPFRTIAAGCLLPDPGGRLTTADVRRHLTETPPVPVAAAAAASATPAPPVSPEADHHAYSTPWDRMPQTRRVTPAALLVGVATAVALLLLVSGYLDRSRPSAVPPATAQAMPEEPTRSRTAPEPASPQSDVDSVVTKWAEAFRRKDVDTEVSLYAPRVKRFFLTNNVTRDFVRRTKASALRSAGQIRRYELQNINTQFTNPSSATVTFDKTWEFTAGRKPTGKVKGELKLERQNGEWRIVSERDLQVYNQTRSRA